MIGDLKLLRAATKQERLYAYRSPGQIPYHVGLLGYLRGDFNGDVFYSSFENGPLQNQKESEGFTEDFDYVMSNLRKGILAKFNCMVDFCKDNPTAKFKGACYDEYCFRVDTESFTYIIRMIPVKGDYNVYIHCYIKQWFGEHLSHSANGIRFITPSYRVLFRIPDGGKIKITQNGEVSERICRYIDEYHTIIGCNAFHICEFAEMIERNGSVVEPVLGVL